MKIRCPVDSVPVVGTELGGLSLGGQIMVGSLDKFLDRINLLNYLYVKFRSHPESLI